MKTSSSKRSAVQAPRWVHALALITFFLLILFEVIGCDKGSQTGEKLQNTERTRPERIEDRVESPAVSEAEKEGIDSLQIVDEEVGGGSVKFVETLYDFGKLKWNTDVAHSYKFTNVGEEPLKITRVRSCCPCIVAKTASELIEPGGTGSIEVTFITKGIIGEQHKAVYIHTSDPENKVVTLEIRGELTVDFVVRPRRVNFGRLVPGEPHSQEIHLIAKNLKNLEIREIDIPVDYMSVTSEPYDGKKGEGIEITVTLSPDAPHHFIDEEIRITTNSKEKPVVDIQVVAWWER
jgi:hypothetical protein